MEPHLLEAYGFILWADLPNGAIGSPTCSSEKPAQGIVGCVHPAARPDKPISAQRVGAGVQQPRSMALMLGRRIHDELINRPPGASVRILVLVGHGGRESHHSLAIGCDKNPERGLGRLLDRLTPGVDHVRQRHRVEHQLRKVGRPLDRPGAALQTGDV